MTTTLSEGVKVPDVGSVNWAGDLEVNWNLLNGALANLSGNVKLDRDNTWAGEQSFTLPIVGSITGTASQAFSDEDGTNIKTGYVNRTTNQSIAGQKTFFDNTFFPSPVYHKNTTYEIGNIPTSNIVTNIYFADKNSVYTGFARNVIYSSGRTATELRAKNLVKNGALDPTGSEITSSFNVEVQPDGSKTLYFDGSIRNNVLPYATNTYSLGSSSYQWSSVYAQTYYYNGAAWGLDKANTWTASNTYSAGNAIIIKNNSIEIGNEPSAYNEQRVLFNDKNGYGIAGIKYQNQPSSSNSFVNGLEFSASDKFKNGVRDATGTTITNTLRMGLWNDGTKYIYSEGRWRTSLIPFTNNAVDIGSSTNQWKSVYAQSYYYNGTAWGLDKANVWSGNNEFSANAFVTVRGYRFRIKNDSMVLGTVPSGGNLWTGFQFMDKNDSPISEILQSFQSNGNSLYQINVFPNETNSEKRSIFAYTYNSTNGANNVAFTSDVVPRSNNTYNLGTSTNKWKTLNGINPGALSLPDYANYVDITSSMSSATLDGTTSIDINDYLPNMTGWLNVVIADTTGNYIFATQGKSGAASSFNASRSFHAGASAGGYIVLFMPIVAGSWHSLFVKASSLTQVRFYPCLGNV